MNGELAIFLTYSRQPHFDELGYEDWLREHDNPFFNSIPGIARYENWVLVRADADDPGFDYFDMIYLDGSRDLESVWFDESLTKFRRGWVAKWGYGAGRPSLVNGQGYVLRGGTMPESPPPEVRLDLSDDASAGSWTIVATMPKHYACPQGAAPEPWKDTDLSALPLPGRVLSLRTGGVRGMPSRRIA